MKESLVLDGNVAVCPISYWMILLQMLVYSLGMTLYWSVDFHLPQNQVGSPYTWLYTSYYCCFFYFHHSLWQLFSTPSQPVQLSDHLNSLLLSMCEDLAHRRVNLNSILEACESHHKASILPSPAKVIRNLVEEVFHESVSLDVWLSEFQPLYRPLCMCQNLKVRCMVIMMVVNKISFKWQCFLFLQMDHSSLPDSNIPLSGRSQMIRERLHGEHTCWSPINKLKTSTTSHKRGENWAKH